MSKPIRPDYDKTYLLPPSIEDWVNKDHPARFIREFVEGLDLKKLGFKVEDNNNTTEGRPHYSSELLLKLWLYGCFSRINSLRELEKQSIENIALIWLIAMERPDHNTIWRFWDKNKESIKRLFKEAVLIADKLNLVDMVLNAIDGTKLRSYSSNKGIRTKTELEQMLKALESQISEMENNIESDIKANKDGQGYSLPEELREKKVLKEKIKEAYAELKGKQSKINPNEKQARAMAEHRLKKNLSYNAQIAVDNKTGIIVASELRSDINDLESLMPMIESIEQTTGRIATDTVADSGYASSTQLGLVHSKEESVFDKSITVNINGKSNLAIRKDKPYHPSNFKYNEPRDIFICPEGKDLIFKKYTKHDKIKEKVKTYYGMECSSCIVRAQCLRKDERRRKIILNPHWKAIEKQRKRQNESEFKELLKKRKSIVEPVFAIIKQSYKFRRFSLKGNEKASQQWKFVCTLRNLRIIFKHYWCKSNYSLSIA